MRCRPSAQVLSALIAVVAAASMPNTVMADEQSAAPQSCIHHPSIKRSKVLNDRNILFVMNNKQMYNNVLPRQCPGMRANSTLSYTYSDNSSLCRDSTVTVLKRVGVGTNTTPITIPGTNEHIAVPAPAFVPTFVCPLGYFVPITQDEVDLLVATTDRETGRRERRRGGRDLVTTDSVELPKTTE